MSPVRIVAMSRMIWSVDLCSAHPSLDKITAAIAEANGCVVVTDNEKNFDGVETAK